MNVTGLDAAEQQIAAQLASYHRKIQAVRNAAHLAPEMHSTEGLETPRTGRNKRRPKIDRAVAEDYRHARSVQKLMQGVCTTQMVLSIVLALMSGNFALLSFLFGDAFGLAATFARVQRMHGVCAVFNVSYLLSSCGMPVVLAIALAHHGSAQNLADHIQESHDNPMALVVIGIIGGISSILGGILAAYVLARPLQLYRYESVALDEEMADKRSERRMPHGGLELGEFGGGFGDHNNIEPIDAWMSAGEAGVAGATPSNSASAAKVKPLIFNPVKVTQTPQKIAAPPSSSTVPMPMLPPPPDRRESQERDGGGGPAAPNSAASTSASTSSKLTPLPPPSSPQQPPSQPKPPPPPQASGELPAANAVAATPEPVASSTATPASEGMAAAKAAEAAEGEGGGAGGAAAANANAAGPAEAGAAAADAEGEAIDAAEEFGQGVVVDGEEDEDEEEDNEEENDEDEEEGAEAAAATAEAAEGGDTAEAAGGEKEEAEKQQRERQQQEGEAPPPPPPPPSSSSPAVGGSGGGDFRARLKEKAAALQQNLKEKAADAIKTVAESAYTQQSAEELFAKAKALNKEGKYKRACDLLEEAYTLQPKISTALSAANLRLKIGEYEKAAVSYRKVLSLVGTPTEEGGPTEREREMADRKLAEAESLKKESAINVSPIARVGEKHGRTAGWYATQLEELSEELFSESATLYAEHGVQLQDGLKEVVRMLRSNRLLACGQVLRPVERLITKAVLSPRDEGEREWLTTVRSILNDLRAQTSEVASAIVEFDEQGRLGWKSAGEAMGFRTEWRHSEDASDGSLWFRMEGELVDANLVHAAAVAHETELWPRWVPFCTAAETLEAYSATERVTYLQLDFGSGFGTSVLKRGAMLHWSLSDSLAEKRSLLLLGASLGEASPLEKPPHASSVTLCDFRCIKALLTPLTRTSCQVRCVTNVDLKAGSMPKPLVEMVTKKIAGALLASLVREAQKITAVDAEAEASGGAPAVDNPYLKCIRAPPPPAGGPPAFYGHIEGLLGRYFEMFGEEPPDDDEDEEG